MYAFKKFSPVLRSTFLGLFICVFAPALRAQTPSFQVAPRPTEVQIGATVGVGAVVSGSAAASYVWKKAGVVVGSGSAVAANDWKSVAAGASHTLALKNDGSLWGWGSNQSGQLALASASPGSERRSAPTRIGSAADWAGVFASGDRSCAIKKDGTAWYWGETAGSPGMIRVAGDQFWESAAFGGTGSMYLVSLGGIYVFQPGMGSAPSPIGTARDWASLSAWGEMVVALKRDGTLWAYNPMGAGMGQSSPNGGFYNVAAGRWKAACAGPGYAVALREDGTLWAWQRMAGGGGWPLFVNNWQTQYSPRRLGSRSDWKSLAADVLPLAVDAEGRVHQVAEGWSQRIGEIPVACRSVSGRTVNNSKRNSEGLALGADGTLWAWGGNDYGQIGDLQDTTYLAGMVRYDAAQVGVHQRWGLGSPVLGVPLGLVLPNFQEANLGVYELQVNSVAAGSVALAQWTSQPETRRITAGASLQLAAAGSLGIGAVPTYQWYRNGVAVSGATSPSYSLANAQTSASGVYWLEITRGGVAARSESASVVVEESAIAAVHTLLAAKSHAAASSSLATILQTTPSHPAANVLKAFTDLYLLIQDSRTTAMLTQLGFTGSADPLNFTLQHAGFPAGGALTSEARNWMKDILYPKLKEAEARLGNVTSTGFTAALVASDFGSISTETLPFDYGDVQVARAGLNLVMSLLKWVETQNTDVSLLALNDKRNTGGLSLESLLAMYPNLLNASATATEAQTEFVDRFGKAISYYLNFSAFANPPAGSTGAKRLDAEEAFFTLTTDEDREGERRLKLDCERLQASIAATSAGAGLQSFSLPTSGFEGTLAVQASPWVFFKHAPGWRNELPSFKANAYVPGTLRADTAIAFYPALRLEEIGRLEAELAASEPGLTEWFKTGRETVPPNVQLLSLNSGSASVTLQNGASLATNGWVTVSGTVADVTGVGRVLVTRTSGVDVASAVARIVERAPTTGAAARVYDWTAQLPAVVGAGTLAASAWDFSGNVTTTSATVTFSAAAATVLPVVPEQAREIVTGGAAAMAVVVPTAGTLQFTWRRNGAALQAGTASAVDDWASVSIGGDHTAAIKQDGTLWTWGSNSEGQLGTGTGRQFPQRVGNASNWASVSCGKSYTTALTRSGSLWVSGRSPFGTFQQLTALTSPTATGQTWARVSTSDNHALALTRSGRLFVWSDGTGTPVDSGSEWAEIATGNGRGAQMNFAIKRDGTLWAWGNNANGHLGLGWGYPGTVSTPVQVGTDKDWLTVATCISSTWNNVLSAAIKKDGTLWAWGFAPNLFPDTGWNSYRWGGQMTPRRVGPQDARWAAVAIAEYAFLGTRPDGKLFEIGDDWISAKAVSPNVVSTAAAGYSYGAVGTDGVLWMWGWNNFGQAGNYTPRDLSNQWQDWRLTNVPDPVQAGVNPDWGLPSPVRGIPVPLSFDPLPTDGLGAYNLTVSRGASTATSVASFYSWPQPSQPYVIAVGGGSLRLQGGINAGSSTVSYQWYKNGVAVPGGTSPELVIPAVPGNAGSYWVQAVSGKTSIRGRATAAVVDSANLEQAREALNVRNFALASSKLNLALAANPVDGAALFLRSALDLYNLWSDPGVATNLAALGFTGSADPLNSTLRWSAEGFPKGALSAPVRAWLVGTLYPKIAAAEANLAKITDTGFVTAFGPYELGLQGEDSVIDYGDVQVLRAFLNAALAAVKWLEAQNTDVDLAALQLDAKNGRLSIESLLAKYPLLLTASTTGPAAQAEFVSRFKQALERYKAFSDFANPAGAPALGQRQDQSIGTARIETAEDRDAEREFRNAVNKILESINAADAVAGRRTLQTADGFSLTASPHAFFQHAPGWRSDLPRFSGNLYQRNSLNRNLLQSMYPALSLNDEAGLEEAMIASEPKWTKALGTRADSTPPVLEMSPVTALSSYDGWANLEGTVQDAAGVRSVTVTLGADGAKEVFEAELEELIPAADGTRLYRWRVALPLSGTGVGPLAFSLSAEDVFGGVLESPLVKVLPVERMVPLSIGSRGEGDLSYTVTPAADENGFVRVGAKLVLVAKPKAGNLLRRIETIVDGEPLPQPAFRSSTLTLTIRGETAVSAVFEPNPYLRIGGRNRMAGGMLRAGYGEWARDGSLPMGALQVSLNPAGSFSGRLRVGLSSYALAGRFDADGFYSVRLPQQLVSLSWNGPASLFVRPVSYPLSVELKMWVDTSNGVDAPILLAEFAGGYGSIKLSALAARDYAGQPVFTGYLAGGDPPEANYENVGISEASRQLWNRTPGWWSVSARKSGNAVLTGWVPGRGRFVSSGYLSNQATLGYSPGVPATSLGEYADIQMLASVNADTVLRWMSTLYTPAAGNGYIPMGTGPSASGTARTEMWYPGNRGPVFESVSPSAIGTNAYVAFASVGTLGGVGFTPAVPGQTLAPFVTTTTAPGTGAPRKLAAKFAFGGVSGADPTPSLKAFELQSPARNVVSVVPGSANYLTAPQMSLNAASGVLSGSAQVGGKRVSLQGVLLQRTMMNGYIPQSLRNVYGLGMTSDGDPFVLTEPTP